MNEKISKITKVLSDNNVKYEINDDVLKTKFYSAETIYKTIEAIGALRLVSCHAITVIPSFCEDKCSYSFAINFSCKSTISGLTNYTVYEPAKGAHIGDFAAEIIDIQRFEKRNIFAKFNDIYIEVNDYTTVDDIINRCCFNG